MKIESGARSALDPHQPRTVTPYIADDLDWTMGVPNVTTIAAERTFWDKVMILHGLRCGYEGGGRIPRDNNPASRHYYDVAMIAKSETGGRAIDDRNLLDSVREYSKIMFDARAWQKLDEARPGDFLLVPQDGLLRALERDYAATTKNMMLGDGPAFDEVVEDIRELQARLND